jgi:hypothetical protein
VLLASWEFTGELEREEKTEKWYRDGKRSEERGKEREGFKFPAADL